MASGPRGNDLGDPFGRIFGEGTVSGLDEGELLRRFATRRDPAALEALVVRHGPMVLGVCRRILGNWHSSEDAFQATFLVLTRRAGTIRDPGRLGPWLHGVAQRVALRLRADQARRRAKERTGTEEPAMAAASDGGELEYDRAELRAALDEEVRRLPGKFRDPIILCYLDGLTHDEAADRLRCPVGTVRSRLSTGRARLRERLGHRGVAVPVAVFAGALTAEAASAAVSPALLIATVRASTAFAASITGATVAGLVPATVASLAEGVTTTMIVSQLKIVAGLALAGILTLGVGAAAAQKLGGSELESKTDDTTEVQIAKLKQQAEASEVRAKKLEAEIKALSKELEAARDRSPKLAEPGKKTETTSSKASGTGTAATVVGGSGTLNGPVTAANEIFPKGSGGGMIGGSGGAVTATGMGAVMSTGKPSLTSFSMNDYVVVNNPQKNNVSAYSNESSQWVNYKVPKGVEVVPVGSNGVLALMMTGDSVGQIAAFTPRPGVWYPIDLKEPAQGRVVPIISPSMAVYAIGRFVYAFSAQSLSWDVLELKEGAKPVPVVGPNRATVELDDHLYIFSLKTGKWTDFDATKGQVVEPEGK